MRIIRNAERRITTTPNATMTTLASPSLGDASRSIWLVEMPPDAVGPWHAFEDEVIWAVLDGEAILSADDVDERLTAGDTAVLPSGRPRRLQAGGRGFRAVVTTSAPGAVTREDGSPAGVPPWVS